MGLPELRNRFNIEKMLEESLRGNVEAKLSFGESSNMKTVKAHAEFEKTEELKREIRESPEFKKCMIEQRHQQVLSPICNLVRSQAGSLDKVHITIDTPKSWARSSFMTLWTASPRLFSLATLRARKSPPELRAASWLKPVLSVPPTLSPLLRSRPHPGRLS